MKTLLAREATVHRNVNEFAPWRAALGLLLVLGAVLVIGSAPAFAEKEADPAPVPVPAELLGAWHSASIDGDALFLVVDAFQVEFFDDGKFRAHVVFTDEQTQDITGQYRVGAGNSLVFEVPEKKLRESVTFEFHGKRVLRIVDSTHGVTIEVKRGKAKKSSGDDWF